MCLFIFSILTSKYITTDITLFLEVNSLTMIFFTQLNIEHKADCSNIMVNISHTGLFVFIDTTNYHGGSVFFIDFYCQPHLII